MQPRWGQQREDKKGAEGKPSGKTGPVARMERSAIRGHPLGPAMPLVSARPCRGAAGIPDYASLHPGYGPCQSYAPNVIRLPVVVTSTLPGICRCASWTKFRPLQWSGITTSGSSFLISATTWVR
jgi:hypothetical protein